MGPKRFPIACEPLHRFSELWGIKPFMRSKSKQRAIIGIVVCLAIGSVGCGSSAPKVQFAKVQGAVLVNGHPQPNVQVQFTPDPGKGIGLPAFAGAVSDDKGNYTLKYSYMNKTGEGAPIG